MISFLKNIVIDPDRGHDWEALERLRFEGEIRTARALPDVPNPNIEIAERSVFVDLIAQPLKGLQGIVASCAQGWKRLAEADLQKESFFHQHLASEPLAVFIDGEVGRAFGFTNLGRQSGLIQNAGTNFRYRAVTVTNFRGSSSKFLNILREMSVRQALETWGPVRGAR